MRSSLLPLLLPFAVLSRAASISCGPVQGDGNIWYYTFDDSFEGELGMLEASGSASLLVVYPDTNVTEIHVDITPCNSTYLSAYPIPDSDNITTVYPVKLPLSNNSTACLALESTDAANAFITIQPCVDDDDETQKAQFWTWGDDNRFTPTWQAVPADRWNLQFNEVDEKQVIANPAECFEGQSCQDSGDEWGILVSNGAPDRH